MQVLQASSVAFGYDTELFRDVTFSLNRGDRAALVAPNGAGKTTLLRVLAGELRPDSGSVQLARDVVVAYYRQSHELADSGTVHDALLSGFQEVIDLRRELAEAERQAASGTKQALEQLAGAMDRYQLAGGDEVERRIEMVAQNLGFAAGATGRTIASLSGGERGRLRLGITLIRPADLLLLDEPTNHLDLDTIRWLEQHLCAASAAVLCVSHDRAFLDAVCPQTLELGRRSFRTYSTPYTAYVEARKADLAQDRAQVEHQRANIAKTEDFIRRNIAGQKTKQAQSRRRMLSKTERLEMPEDVWAIAQRVRFRFAEAPRSGDIVLESTGLGAERAGRPLFEGLDLLVRRGDRIGVIGPNGCGKTTLLRLLAGKGQPADRGKVRRGTNLCDGFYDQHLGTLQPERSAIEEIRSIRGELNDDGAREYLASFRFWGDDPFRTVESLSGGECARLALAKLLLEPLNLLFLDEPTNHLDIPAAEILEQALANFPGSVLLASHDRRFLETVTTRIVAFDPSAGGVLEVYEGRFGDYMEQCVHGSWTSAAPAELPPTPNKQKKKAPKRAAPAGPNDGRKRSSSYAEQKRASRELQRKQRRMTQLEEEVADAEADLELLRDDLQKPPEDDWEQLAELARRERKLQKQVDTKMAEWLELSEELAATLANEDK